MGLNITLAITCDYCSKVNSIENVDPRWITYELGKAGYRMIEEPGKIEQYVCAPCWVAE